MAQTEKEIQLDPSTAAKFDRLLKEQTPEYSKWTDLEINKIYTVTNTTMVNTKKGETMVLSLYNYGEVWAPDHLKTRITKNNLSPPLYIRPLGLKPCKDNPANTCHAYDLVVGKKIGGKSHM